MAKHTFVTESHTWPRGDDKKTVEILSRSEVATIAAEAAEEVVSDLPRKLSSQERKLVKALEQAADAAKDSAAARKTVERLVETTRETFRDIIEELLAPHYRLLAQHLGIEMPVETAKGKIKFEKDPGNKDSKRTPSKKTARAKLMVAASRSTRKGVKPCR